MQHESQFPNLKSGMTTNSTLLRAGYQEASARGGMVWQSEGCEVLTKVISRGPSLPWSPAWPEQQVEGMRNEGFWRSPDPS